MRGEKKLTDISQNIDGFSDREISKMVIAWQVYKILPVYTYSHVYIYMYMYMYMYAKL